MDLVLLRNIAYALFKDPSAYLKNYIGHEEHYI